MQDDITPTRLTALRARMAATATDLVVIGPSSHMAWLAGLDPHGDERPVLLIVSRSHAGVLMPALNAAAARAQSDLPFYPWDDADGPDAALAALLGDCGATGPGLSVVLDETMRADFAMLALGALDAPRHRFSGDTVGALRARKDAGEIALLQASQALNDAAMALALDSLQGGMTERDLARIITGHYQENGARTAFCTVAFGANSAFPHHATGDTVLRPGMAVLVDCGCRLGGYPSDMTRTTHFGPAPAGFDAIRAIVEQAVQAALAAARPGARACDVDRAARDVIAQAGHGPDFVHRTGHGLGLDVHEPPWITATSQTVLETGHVFSIEPGIYLQGRFGIRLEEVVVLTETGPQILSRLPRL